MTFSEEYTSSLALVVLDMQDRFLKVMPDRGTLIRRVTFAVATARLLGIHICFTEQSPEKLGPTLPEILEAGRGDTSEPAPVYPKSAFSALDAEGLLADLRAREVEHLLLAGIEVPVCVYQTALQALREDFDITLLHDCVGGRRHDDFPPVYRFLERNEVCLLPSETVFYSLLQGADHPRFRDYTALVKQYA